MDDKKCKCSHDMWGDHEYEESYDPESGEESYWFIACLVEGCDCKRFEVKEEDV